MLFITLSLYFENFCCLDLPYYGFVISVMSFLSWTLWYWYVGRVRLFSLQYCQLSQLTLTSCSVPVCSEMTHHSLLDTPLPTLTPHTPFHHHLFCMNMEDFEHVVKLTTKFDFNYVIIFNSFISKLVRFDLTAMYLVLTLRIINIIMR